VATHKTQKRTKDLLPGVSSNTPATDKKSAPKQK